jgi:uncharacterized membrane protein
MKYHTRNASNKNTLIGVVHSPPSLFHLMIISFLLFFSVNTIVATCYSTIATTTNVGTVPAHLSRHHRIYNNNNNNNNNKHTSYGGKVSAYSFDSTSSSIINFYDAFRYPQNRHPCYNFRIKLGSTNNDDSPDPSILVASQSSFIQQLVFVLAFVLLGIGTNVCINLWYTVGVTLLGSNGFGFIRTVAFPILFGFIFTFVGISHFTLVDNYAQIVPPRGTWGGLWQIPAPLAKELGISYGAYHSYWTGVAEVIGGLWLLLSGIGIIDHVEPPAIFLFLLTIVVSPANLYMFTHDAKPGGDIPNLQYPFGHLARFVLQCGLLSNFWIISQPQ